MVSRKIKTVISTGISIGFLTGFGLSCRYIIANRYIQYGMANISMLYMRNFLNRWTLRCAVLSVAFFILWQACAILRKGPLKVRPMDNLLPGHKLFGRIMAAAAALFITILIVMNVYIVAYARTNRPEGPNIMLITIDTVRADRLGCYGYQRPTTPHIDAFSKRCTIFKNAITPRANTTPSVTSMLTGLYPHTHGVRTGYMPLDMKFNTLQEMLRDRNYLTAAFVSNWVLKKEFSRLDPGFSAYNDTMSEEDLNRYMFERLAPDTSSAALRWLDEHRNEKFFLWAHYQDPHGPYRAPKEYSSFFTHNKADLIPFESVRLYQRLPWIRPQNDRVDANAYRDAYDAEIRFCDEYIGKLLAKIEEPGLRDTVVIMLADHGEGLGEHGYYFGHGKFVYDQCSKVPLLLYVPGIRPAAPIEGQVNIMNITPTILDILGYPIPPGMEGRSLLPQLAGRERSGDEYIFLERKNYMKGVRTDEWKYIRRIHHAGAPELYNLKEDPMEEHNVIAYYPDIASGLNSRLNRWMNENDLISIKQPRKIKIKKQDRDALRSLGYLQ